MVQAQGPMPTPLVQLARAATLGATDVRDLACYGTVATCMRSRAGLLVCGVIVLVPPAGITARAEALLVLLHQQREVFEPSRSRLGAPTRVELPELQCMRQRLTTASARSLNTSDTISLAAAASDLPGRRS